MSLKGKVKSVESRVMENSLQFCRCFNDYTNAAIDEVYNGVPNPIDYESLPKDFCQKCRKPVNTEFIENFNRQLEMILPAYSHAPVIVSASAKEAVESALSGVLSGVLLVEAARRLGVSLNDVNRYIRSGRLRLDGSGKFVDLDSLDALQRLIQSKS